MLSSNIGLSVNLTEIYRSTILTQEYDHFRARQSREDFEIAASLCGSWEPDTSVYGGWFGYFEKMRKNRCVER
jgi:hypothetical protein